MEQAGHKKMMVCRKMLLLPGLSAGRMNLPIDGKVFCSTNNGANWTNISNGLNSPVRSIAISGNNIFAGTEGKSLFTIGDGIYLSSNNGANWTQVNNGLPLTIGIHLAVSGNNVFAGLDSGIFLSTNNGSNWTKVNDGELTGVANELKTLPQEYTLFQNYPNPFNPSTTIKYSLPIAGNVLLTVYNSIGSKVVTIVNEYKPAGNYSVQFNGSNLASGIYLYRLEIEGFSTVRKFIILK
jgi:hypothetical protein